MRAVDEQPKEANKICISLSEKIKEEFKEFDLILSPAMGGIIVIMKLEDIRQRDDIF